MNTTFYIAIILIVLLTFVLAYVWNKYEKIMADNATLRDTIATQEQEIKVKDRMLSEYSDYPEPEMHYEGFPTYKVSFKAQCLDETKGEARLKILLRQMCKFKSSDIKVSHIRISKQ